MRSSCQRIAPSQAIVRQLIDAIMFRKYEDRPIPPDNYSAIDLQMMKLRSIPAKMEAERLIAEKFGMEPPGLIQGELPAPILDEMRTSHAVRDKWAAEHASMRRMSRASVLILVGGLLLAVSAVTWLIF